MQNKNFVFHYDRAISHRHRAAPLCEIAEWLGSMKINQWGRVWSRPKDAHVWHGQDKETGVRADVPSTSLRTDACGKAHLWCLTAMCERPPYIEKVVFVYRFTWFPCQNSVDSFVEAPMTGHGTIWFPIGTQPKNQFAFDYTVINGKICFSHFT